MCKRFLEKFFLTFNFKPFVVEHPQPIPLPTPNPSPWTPLYSFPAILPLGPNPAHLLPDSACNSTQQEASRVVPFLQIFPSAYTHALSSQSINQFVSPSIPKQLSLGTPCPLQPPSFSFFFFFFIFLPFLGLYPWHMEVPRLGV